MQIPLKNNIPRPFRAGLLILTIAALSAQRAEGEGPDLTLLISSTPGNLALSGDVSSGLWAHFNDKMDGDPFLQIAGVDGVPVRVNLNVAYSTTPGNLGFNFVLRGQAKNTSAGDDKPRIDPNRNNGVSDILFFERAYAYIKMFSGLVTFTGGYWSPNEYSTPGGLDSDLNMEGAGLMVNVVPLEGLNVVASIWAKQGDTTLLKEAKYIFSGSYELPNWFRVNANFAFRQYGLVGFSKNDDIANTYSLDGTSSYNELADRDQRLGFGVSYLGLESLGFRRLGIDTAVYNLGGGRSLSWDETMKVTVTPFLLGQRITWIWNNTLELDARFYQRMNINDDRWDYGPALRFRFAAKYDFDLRDTLLACVVSPKLGFDYFVNSDPWGDNPTDMRFDEGIISWEDCRRMKGGLGLAVGVELNFGRYTFIELGYSLKVNTGKPDDFILVTEKSTVNHGIYLFTRVGMGRN